MPTETQELKSCPFCGGHGTLTGAGFGEPEWLCYVCDKCAGTSGARSTKEAAIELWNTRAGGK